MRTVARAVLVLAVILALAPAAHAWTRSPATTFATLPAGESNPEGIAVDSHGKVYVGTFDVTRAGAPGETGHLVVFSPSGRLLRQVSVQNSSPLLLDMVFQPDGTLLVIDFGNARVLAVDPVTGDSSVFTALPDVDPDPNVGPGPNVLTLDGQGNVYISDSFQGIVWRTGPGGGAPTAWITDARLKTSGVPPFGANGLAFNRAETALFVANTGNDTVLKIPVSGDPLVAGTPQIFANSINGADGLILDEDDNVWVVANQADEIVVLDPTGRTIAKLGDFDGIGHDGAPNGLLFPASLVRSGHWIYVTNLSLDLRLFNPDFTTGDSQWAAQVTRHTVSKIRARIPRVQGLP